MNMSPMLAFLSGAPGGGEIIVIFVVVLLFFGPKKLPQIARMIGKTLDELRRASQDFKDQIMNIDEPPPVDVTPGDSPDDGTTSAYDAYVEPGQEDYYYPDDNGDDAPGGDAGESGAEGGGDTGNIDGDGEHQDAAVTTPDVAAEQTPASGGGAETGTPPGDSAMAETPAFSLPESPDAAALEAPAHDPAANAPGQEDGDRHVQAG